MSLQALDSPGKRPNKPRIGAKVKRALDAMVWEGLPWEQAAAKADLSLQHMRVALRQQHVLAYLKAERVVLRTSLSTRADFRMVELSEQDDNRAAAVSATKELRGLVDQHDSAGQHRAAPGLTIVIETHGPATELRHTEAKPLITLDRTLPTQGSDEP